jgi:hypothetical protein
LQPAITVIIKHASRRMDGFSLAVKIWLEVESGAENREKGGLKWKRPGK